MEQDAAKIQGTQAEHPHLVNAPVSMSLAQDMNLASQLAQQRRQMSQLTPVHHQVEKNLDVRKKPGLTRN